MGWVGKLWHQFCHKSPPPPPMPSPHETTSIPILLSLFTPIIPLPIAILIAEWWWILSWDAWEEARTLICHYLPPINIAKTQLPLQFLIRSDRFSHGMMAGNVCQNSNYTSQNLAFGLKFWIFFFFDLYINAEIFIYLFIDPYINAENCWDFLAVYLNHDITREK